MQRIFLCMKLVILVCSLFCFIDLSASDCNYDALWAESGNWKQIEQSDSFSIFCPMERATALSYVPDTIVSNLVAQVNRYAGFNFFQHLKLETVFINHPSDLLGNSFFEKKCTQTAYYFRFYLIVANQKHYEIGICCDKNGQIITPLNFPAQSPIENFITLCEAADRFMQDDSSLASSVNSIELQFDAARNSFVYKISFANLNKSFTSTTLVSAVSP